MTEKKGPFDAAIDAIRGWQRVVEVYSEKHPDEIADLEEAIHVLLDWHKWKPLIEAAGKVDKGRAIRTLATLLLVYTESEGRIIPALEKALKDGAVREIRALLQALPDKEVEEEPKRYRCESCGKEFDEKLFSHGRAVDDGKGNPVEVECGPISEVK